jgi:hypothetical protein
MASLRELNWHSTWRTKWRVDWEPERRAKCPFWDNPEPDQCPICGGRLPPYPKKAIDGDYQIIAGELVVARCPCPEEAVITEQDIVSRAYYSLPLAERPKNGPALLSPPYKPVKPPYGPKQSPASDTPACGQSPPPETAPRSR